MNFSNFRREYRKFLEVVRPMTWRQRVEHILFAYKEYVLLLALVAVVLTCILYIAFSAREDVVFSGTIVNVDITADGRTYVTQQQLLAMGGDPDAQKAELTDSSFQQMQSIQQIDMNYNEAMALMARISEGMVDYLIMDELAMEYYISQDMLGDMSEILTEQDLAQFGDQLVYARNENETRRWPVAVNISKLPFVQDCILADRDVYLAFPGNTGQNEACRLLWQRLLEWKENGGT